MAAPRKAEREDQGRIELRTLVIASAASAAAAAVTSQLWIAGTWIAAAVTPVLVTLLSEALHRPTERIARASRSWTAERSPARESRSRGDEPLPEAAGASPPPPPDPEDPLPALARSEPAPPSGVPGPVRVYRRPAARTRRRRFALGAAVVTGAIAFVVAILVITTADLVSGGSVGKGSGGTTLFGGGADGPADRQQEQSEEAPARNGSQPENDGSEQPSQTAPAPEETAPEQPAPEEPAPTEPAPGESVPTEPLPEVPTP